MRFARPRLVCYSLSKDEWTSSWFHARNSPAIHLIGCMQRAPKELLIFNSKNQFLIPSPAPSVGCPPRVHRRSAPLPVDRIPSHVVPLIGSPPPLIKSVPRQYDHVGSIFDPKRWSKNMLEARLIAKTFKKHLSNLFFCRFALSQEVQKRIQNQQKTIFSCV